MKVKKENTEKLAAHFDIRKPTENKTSLLSEFLGVEDKEIPKRTGYPSSTTLSKPLSRSILCG